MPSFHLGGEERVNHAVRNALYLRYFSLVPTKPDGKQTDNLTARVLPLEECGVDGQLPTHLVLVEIAHGFDVAKDILRFGDFEHLVNRRRKVFVVADNVLGFTRDVAALLD